jgi:UDP-N-acetylglucosamine acyltransferase
LPDVHPTALVDATATLGEGTVVGPYAIVEAGVVLGAGCLVEAHAMVRSGTTMGERNVVGQGAVLGGDPQDTKFQRGMDTFLQVGDDNTFREYVTVHRATGEGQSTVVGNRNYLMAYVHLGHNVTLMDDVVIASHTGISGHVTVEDRANIGGMAGIHQWARIGRVAMVGGMSRIVRDVPPFMITEGEDAVVHDINAVGLRRMGITQSGRQALHKACKLLFKSQLGLRNAMEIVRREIEITPEVEYLLEFEERRYRGKNGRGDQA